MWLDRGLCIRFRYKLQVEQPRDARLLFNPGSDSPMASDEAPRSDARHRSDVFSWTAGRYSLHMLSY